MSKIDLNNTKQSAQINLLRNKLNKVGWKIIGEYERKYQGKPR